MALVVWDWKVVTKPTLNIDKIDGSYQLTKDGVNFGSPVRLDGMRDGLSFYNAAQQDVAQRNNAEIQKDSVVKTNLDDLVGTSTQVQAKIFPGSTPQDPAETAFLNLLIAYEQAKGIEVLEAVVPSSATILGQLKTAYAANRALLAKYTVRLLINQK